MRGAGRGLATADPSQPSATLPDAGRAWATILPDGKSAGSGSPSPGGRGGWGVRSPEDAATRHWLSMERVASRPWAQFAQIGWSSAVRTPSLRLLDETAPWMTRATIPALSTITVTGRASSP